MCLVGGNGFKDIPKVNEILNAADVPPVDIKVPSSIIVFGYGEGSADPFIENLSIGGVSTLFQVVGCLLSLLYVPLITRRV